MGKFKITISFLIVLSLFFAGCAGTSSISRTDSFTKLRSQIDSVFSQPYFAHAHWGAYIKSLKTGKVWYSRNANKMFMPASNEKIPSAASALTVLGPQFKFETDLCYDGSIAGDTLKGNLIVFGNGDPTLYSHFQKDPRDLFRSWAVMLKGRGIKNISGNVIGDDNAFEDEALGYGWSFDGLDSWYSAEVGALQFNEDYIDLRIVPPSTVNGEVEIIPNIPTKYFNIIKNIEVTDTGRTRIFISRPYGTNDIHVNGVVRAGSRAFERSPSIHNPTLFYVTVLKETLEEEGINVNGKAEDCDDIEGWQHTAADFNILDKHLSPPMKDIIKEMMKRSQNLYAETMPRILGWYKTGEGSFREGKRVVADVLKKFGIEPRTYAYMDGSGLSRYDYISPEQEVKILQAMTKSPYWDVWYDALPIAGIDGTLRNRMKGTAAEKNVHAKTGTISNVRGLSGYITTGGGEHLVFSFLVNGHLLTSKDTEDITDTVLEMIADYKGDAGNKEVAASH